ncbi:hypothetical protein TNCV_2006661 [Trichonephila clavipes]|nr:hypothetical protein TNCV_2006661 [Trichonephila clavipes]
MAISSRIGVHETFLSAPSTARMPRGNFQKVRNSMQRCCHTWQRTYGHNFEHLLNCQVIYSQFGLAIHQNDHQARRRFVEWAQNEIAVVPDFHKRILFSDEANFWLNGYVNKAAVFGVKLIHKCMSKHRYIQKN